MHRIILCITGELAWVNFPWKAQMGWERIESCVSMFLFFKSTVSFEDPICS